MVTKVLLFLAISLIVWKDSSQNEIKKTVPVLQNDTVRIFCDEGATLDNIINFEAFKEYTFARKVILDSCAPPSNSSYADLFSALSINRDEVKVLQLVNPPRPDGYNNYDFETNPNPIRPQSKHFSDLRIEELNILNHDGSAAFAINLDFLKDLRDLSSITLDNCDIFGRFPETTKLERVEISGGTLYGDFGACQGFKVLHLTDLNIFGSREEYSYRLLKDCIQLVELKLERMNAQELKHDMFRGLPRSVRNITIRHCKLDEFPYSYSLYNQELITSDYKAEVDDYILTYLDLSYNQLRTAGFVSTHRGLETLDISHNDLSNVMPELPKLKVLKADNNNYTDYCDPINLFRYTHPNNAEHEELLKNLPLKHISLTGTGMRKLCFNELPLSHLELLNLTNNNIAVLNYRQLKNVSDEKFVVDLRLNPLEKVELNQEDYEALKKDDPSVAGWRKIRVITNARFPCNCTNAWFTRAMHEGLLKVEGATCDDGSPLKPRSSYALQGCGAACEGFDGCATASSIRNFMENKDKYISIFSEQNSIWWLASEAYNMFVHK